MITVITKVGSDQLKQREGISQAASPNKLPQPLSKSPVIQLMQLIECD